MNQTRPTAARDASDNERGRRGGEISSDGRSGKQPEQKQAGKRRYDEYKDGVEEIIHFKNEDSNTPTARSKDDPSHRTKRPKVSGEGERESRDAPQDPASAQANYVDLERELLQAPWSKKQTLRIKSPMIRLHNEIIEFYEYIRPSPAEEASRERAFARIRDLILEKIPDAEIHLFGSYATKLYLPKGDIDFVVVKQDLVDKTVMNRVAKVLFKNEELFEGIQLIRGAKVPIIKFVDKETQVQFDISFNKMDGVHHLVEVDRAMAAYPEMKYVIMVIKLLLRQRDLHETFKGGIGSFLLFCMTLHFLREVRKDYFIQGRQDQLKYVTLGEYVIRFMEYYGIQFDINNKSIILTGGGDVVDKPRGTRDSSFSLISPQDTHHDIGSSSFRIKDVFSLFKNRFNFIVNYNFRPGESILKYIVNPSLQSFIPY
eukprot:TRINITY_DN3062_c0_g1_i1.p1 TRINITY_DN3062_c0_g1~~TRINITY_DN3062_c0_g1_i1.p1  ORF type:complete len:429 (-),score=125.89 TRINITY_DN3062_c0_g1_i1:138-1424(-)